MNCFYNKNIYNNINNEIIPFYSLNMLLDIKKISIEDHKNIISIFIEAFPI